MLTPDPAVWERRGETWYKLGGSNSYKPRVCAQCGVEALMARNQQFCSVACRHAARRGKYKDDPRYRGLHTRLRLVRGLATDYVCACGRPAEEWSYNGGDSDELQEGSLRFSLKLDHYSPRCRRCHHRLDHSGEKNVMATLSDVEIAQIIAEYKAGGVTQTALAAKYGVSQPAVSAWVRGSRREV